MPMNEITRKLGNNSEFLMNTSTERDGPKVASIKVSMRMTTSSKRKDLCSDINYFYPMRKHFRVDSCNIRAQNRSP